MTYDQKITDLLAEIKADKSVIQPWRNKAVARIEEAQAFVRMGKTSTSASVPNESVCTCPMEGVIDKNCPLHGSMM